MLVIGFSGKKQSGKNTSIRYLTANAGLLWPSLCHEDTGGVPRVKTFSMAGPLKRFAVEILGLEPHQVYGTDEDKSTFTRYKWGDLPHYKEIVGNILAHNHERDERGEPKHWRWKLNDDGMIFRDEHGQIVKEYLSTYLEMPKPDACMTARQVLQEVGTGIFRRMWGDIWAQACIRDITTWGGDVAFIDDVRFPNEVAAIQGIDGKVLRLTMDIFKGKDQHDSERALDVDRFDWKKFDLVVANEGTSVDQQNALVVAQLVDKGICEAPPADQHGESICQHLTDLPPIVTEWQQVTYRPKCPYFREGQCLNPSRVTCPMNSALVVEEQVC